MEGGSLEGSPLPSSAKHNTSYHIAHTHTQKKWGSRCRCSVLVLSPNFCNCYYFYFYPTEQEEEEGGVGEEEEEEGPGAGLKKTGTPVQVTALKEEDLNQKRRAQKHMLHGSVRWR